MYTLPALSYDYSALEPYIDARTMEIHYTKHHQGYVNNLNKALEAYPDWQNMPVEELIMRINAVPKAIRTAVRNNGGGHENHSMFWPLMKKDGGGNPRGLIAQAIERHFDSFDAFRAEFDKTAKSVFGSGWAWLSLNAEERLVITSTPNQDNPLSQGLKPVLGLDVWEHAYYLKYQNRRVDYIDAWWHVVNWDQVNENYRALV